MGPAFALDVILRLFFFGGVYVCERVCVRFQSPSFAYSCICWRPLVDRTICAQWQTFLQRDECIRVEGIFRIPAKADMLKLAQVRARM